MQACTKCKLSEPTVVFTFKNKTTGKKNSWCTSCQKQYKDDHYQTNRQRYIEKAHNHRGEYRARIYTQLAEYYREHPCVDCGESDFVVCQSDHVRGKKSFAVSMMIRREASWDRIAEELKKCDTRCANCHFRKTAKELGWYNDLAKVAHSSTG